MNSHEKILSLPSFQSSQGCSSQLVLRTRGVRAIVDNQSDDKCRQQKRRDTQTFFSQSIDHRSTCRTCRTCGIFRFTHRPSVSRNLFRVQRRWLQVYTQHGLLAILKVIVFVYFVPMRLMQLYIYIMALLCAC
jgi:hypothetical protein